MKKKTAIIIGAGPAGLTAAYELLNRTDIHPVIYEMTDKIGGICRTEDYKGNKIDVGGHRFFTKHKIIMDWWLSFLPLQSLPETSHGRGRRKGKINVPGGTLDPETTDRVMLIRNRRSSILFHNKFFDYPISLSPDVLTGLGIGTSLSVLLSYIKARAFPIRKEQALEDFFINRFGKHLYSIFFKDYTEKLWGVPCRDISPDWGIQRIKGLSISKAVFHALKKQVFRNRVDSEKTETSLIDQFYYPKFGPGQLWSAVAEEIQQKGGEIFLNHKVTGLAYSGDTVSGINVEHLQTGQKAYIEGDYFISTMPVKELIRGLENPAPAIVREIAGDLYYRDLIIAGLMFKTLKLKNDARPRDIIPDCWLYIQDKEVKIGRIQIMNNWNPYMVARKDTIWLGVELCCSRKDAIWNMADENIIASVVDELVTLDIVSREDMIDGVVVRQANAYPGYTGAYNRIDVIREFTDSLRNLFLIGRNGMHRYNNMDHSMLTAIKAVENIVAGEQSKDEIWNINVEDVYYEIK